jgi:hypothetical protein
MNYPHSRTLPERNPILAGVRDRHLIVNHGHSNRNVLPELQRKNYEIKDPEKTDKDEMKNLPPRTVISHGRKFA